MFHQHPSSGLGAWLVPLYLIIALPLCHTQSDLNIDNNLKGDPVVDCQDTMVSLTFRTNKPFSGRVYVKGLAEDEKCSRNFATNHDQSKFSMMIGQGDCNMQRTRNTQGPLEGLVFSLVIVVSFHGTFVTRADRAFRCMCFFRNIKRVTNMLDMSVIGTTELLDTAKMPTCTYTIHQEAPDGPLVKYAKIGDKIFHTWQCDDEHHGFLVHSCWVNDGRGNQFDLLDIDGCAIDPIIQPDVQYDPELLTAFVETHGYKFSDTSVLDYQCVIELCKKALGECEGLTPPICGRGKRSTGSEQTRLHRSVKYPDRETRNDTGSNPERAVKRRQSSKPLKSLNHNDLLSSYLPANELDVTAEMNVIDTLDDGLGPNSGPPPSDLLRALNERVYRPYMGQVQSRGRNPRGPIGHSRGRYNQSIFDSQLCLSVPAFGMIVGVTIVLLCAAITSSSILFWRSNHRKY